jgi:hypothetical protein
MARSLRSPCAMGMTARYPQDPVYEKLDMVLFSGVLRFGALDPDATQAQAPLATGRKRMNVRSPGRQIFSRNSETE